ncbi:Sybindin-like protein [Carpediemonas membranifera]|uniref:Trafficking protein particle complex subunit n=1 Tax=Carpediemonas membranifera TaxID=201153 RepID=A0A8J6DXB4_9EUKA|nr:Sybindin-like protein [Carpediemonas membranifera]|eukprot:KAG9389814.1 Sybindin-like protein [Carpediemonas membranifera]
MSSICMLVIFNRSGEPIFERSYQWSPTMRALLPQTTPCLNDEAVGLLSGLVFSLRPFVSKISPKNSADSVNCFTTEEKTYHLLETATGLKFIIVTGPNVTPMTNELQQIYQLFASTVALNPLNRPHQASEDAPSEGKADNKKPNGQIVSASFCTALDSFLTRLSS